MRRGIDGLEYDIILSMARADREQRIPARLTQVGSPGDRFTTEKRVGTIPDRRLPWHSVIALPIAERGTIVVPSRPLFVEELPIIERMMDIPLGRDTRQKKEEPLYVGGVRFQQGDSPYMVKISVSGMYPHNRSFEYLDYTDPVAKSIIVDGRDYSSLSTKGGDYEEAKIVWKQDMPANVLLYGMMTKAYAQNAILVSEWLREAGIESEVIVGVSQLEMIPWVTRTSDSLFQTGHYSTHVELITPDIFKEHLLKTATDFNAYVTDAGSFVSEAQSISNYLQFDTDAVRSYLDETDFVVLHRVMNVPFRLSDVYKVFTITQLRDETERQQEFMYMMNYIFSYLNRSREPDEQIAYLEYVDGKGTVQDWSKSISTYWDYVTEKLARQTGVLHSHGVSHGWLHPGNIVADGSFCDSDSYEGPPWDEPFITVEKAAHDLMYALDSLDIMSHEFLSRGWLQRNRRQIVTDFIQQYMRARWPDSVDYDIASALSQEMRKVGQERKLADYMLDWIQQTMEGEIAGSNTK